MNKFSKYLGIFCVLGALVVSSAFANLIITTLDQVFVSMDGIYINTEEGIQPVQSIVEANDGYLVAIPKNASCNSATQWQCPRCQTMNTGSICSKCKWPLY